MDFTKPLKTIFSTPSGRIEFFPRTLEANGLSPLPDFTPVHLPPPGYARLIYGRSPVHTLTSTMNNKWLNHEINENELWLNDTVADKDNRWRRVVSGKPGRLPVHSTSENKGDTGHT
ncbi:MAG: hypothetical protein KAR13_01110, partial [Desulfobulbaceae bacterium]|nr:hypothetical protein [Desulfobulbaceae bacterium]